MPPGLPAQFFPRLADSLPDPTPAGARKGVDAALQGPHPRPEFLCRLQRAPVFVDLAPCQVACACPLAKSGLVHNHNVPAPLFNQPATLKARCRQRHRRSARRQQFGHALLRQRKRIRSRQLRTCNQPTCQPLFHRMPRRACGGLFLYPNMVLKKRQHGPPKVGTIGKDRPRNVRTQPVGRTGGQHHAFGSAGSGT